MTEAGITHYPRWQCTWSAEEIAWLHHGSNLGQTAEEIAAALGRTAKAIREKCGSLGLVTRPRPESQWPKDRLEHCKQLYDEGYSARQSALELNCTRNAVIGIWHRHPDLFRPRLHIVNGNSTVKKMGVRGERKPRREPQHKVALVPQFIPEEITELPFDQSPCAVTFAQLEHQHCRWPISNPSEMMYCGEVVVGGYSWCQRHKRIALVKPRPLKPRPYRLEDRRT